MTLHELGQYGLNVWALPPLLHVPHWSDTDTDTDTDTHRHQAQDRRISVGFSAPDPEVHGSGPIHHHQGVILPA